MCVVSMVGDHYRDKWQREWPNLPGTQPVGPSPLPAGLRHPEVTRAEFDALKRDVLEMKALLKRAKIYDEENGEPDCEIDEKMALLRRMADFVGVDLDEVIGTGQ